MSLLAVGINGGRPGSFYYVSDANVYLGRQKVGRGH